MLVDLGGGGWGWLWLQWGRGGTVVDFGSVLCSLANAEFTVRESKQEFAPI